MAAIKSTFWTLAVVLAALTVSSTVFAPKGGNGKPGGGGGGSPPTPFTAGDWDTSRGGLHDPEAGLVWGTTTSGGWTGDGAAEILPGWYAEQSYAYGKSDWRLPTRAELERAVAQGIHSALTNAAAIHGFPQPVQDDAEYYFWTSQKKGKRNCYLVDLIRGEVLVGSGIHPGILVRDEP